MIPMSTRTMDQNESAHQSNMNPVLNFTRPLLSGYPRLSHQPYRDFSTPEGGQFQRFHGLLKLRADSLASNSSSTSSSDRALSSEKKM